jgi:hypothetical protein
MRDLGKVDELTDEASSDPIDRCPACGAANGFLVDPVGGSAVCVRCGEESRKRDGADPLGR